MLAITRIKVVVILLGLAVTGSSLAAIPVGPLEPTPDTREKMAALHEQMATCLRSDQAFSACQAQMVKSCKEQLGNECRMVGHAGRAAANHMHPMTPAAADK